MAETDKKNCSSLDSCLDFELNTCKWGHQYAARVCLCILDKGQGKCLYASQRILDKCWAKHYQLSFKHHKCFNVIIASFFKKTKQKQAFMLLFLLQWLTHILSKAWCRCEVFAEQTRREGSAGLFIQVVSNLRSNYSVWKYLATIIDGCTNNACLIRQHWCKPLVNNTRCGLNYLQPPCWKQNMSETPIVSIACVNWFSHEGFEMRVSRVLLHGMLLLSPLSLTVSSIET